LSVQINYKKLRKLAPVFGPKIFSSLKIGIHENVIRAHPQFCGWVGRIMRHHTSKRGYLRKMVAGAQRVDLNGEPAGLVTEKEAEIAANRLAKLKAA
jgi:ProP effector